MITSIQAGLADEHRQQAPLFDRVEFQSYGKIRGTRTYPDGAQYLILSDPQAIDAAGPTWSRFVTLTPLGVEQLRTILRGSVWTYVSAPAAAGPSGGGSAIIWVVYLDGQERVVQTPGGNYDQLPPFVRQLDEVVQQNVQPMR